GKPCGAGDGCGGICTTNCCTPMCSGELCGGPDGCGGTCLPGSNCCQPGTCTAPWVMLGDRDFCNLPENGGMPGATFFGILPFPPDCPDPIEGPAGDAEDTPSYGWPPGYGDEASGPDLGPDTTVAFGTESAFWSFAQSSGSDDDLQKYTYLTTDSDGNIT